MAGHITRYVAGLSGTGLLILRATVGVTAILQGCALVSGHESGPPWLWSFAVVLCLGGAALILGALTVLSSLTIGVTEMGAACSLLPSASSAVSHSHEAEVLVIAMTIVVILIGPGAYSIDASLFGLREVKIPRNSPPFDF